MATNFPNGVDNFPTHTDNNNEKIAAVHLNNVQDGLKATQQEVLDMQETSATVGNLSNLTTTDKDSVVDAINELDGNISTLETSNNSLVSRVNDLEILYWMGVI